MAHPDIERLKKQIKDCDNTIEVFEEQVEKEQDTIREYKGYMKDPESSYSKDSLENGIKGCERNIESIESAIKSERNKKKALRFKISKIEELESIPDEIEIGVEIENGSDD